MNEDQVDQPLPIKPALPSKPMNGPRTSLLGLWSPSHEQAQNTLKDTPPPSKAPQSIARIDILNREAENASIVRPYTSWHEGPDPELMFSMRSTAEIMAVHNRQQPLQDDISELPTTLMQAIQAPQKQPGVTSSTNQIYENNALARRLERKRRIEEKKLTWKDVQQFAQFVTPFKWYVIASFLLTVAIGLMALPTPFIFHALIDRVLPGGDLNALIWSLTFLLIVFLLEEGFRFLNRNVLGALTRAASTLITYRFYSHMLRLPLPFYQGLVGSGQAISRLSEVTSAQQTVLQMIIDAGVNILLTIIYVGVLFMTDWRLTLTVIAIAPLYTGVSFYFNRINRRYNRQVMEEYAVLNGIMYEGLNGLKTIKALSAEHRFGRKIKKQIIFTNEISFRRSLFQSQANLIIGIVQAVCTIFIIGFSCYLVFIHVMSLGNLAAFILVLRELAAPVSTLNGLNQQIQAAAVAVDRLFEILNHPQENNAQSSIQLQDIQGHVHLEHVSFSYTPEIEVLHDIHLNVPAGKTIAFVGRSGAGKTTIANLLMRFYQPDSGRITIDGVDLQKLNIESLRSQIGVILQDDSLFSGTIEDNLIFGLLRKVSHAEMREAARNANILEFIESQPLGFKTVLKERGQSLSTGQRQRLSIARMFLRQPKILIMDEPSSALDNESEAKIQQALQRLTKGRTTFIIAHRLTTIRDADSIVIIDEGRIAEQGKHEELLKRKGVYWKLYNSYGRV